MTRPGLGRCCAASHVELDRGASPAGQDKTANTWRPSGGPNPSLSATATGFGRAPPTSPAKHARAAPAPLAHELTRPPSPLDGLVSELGEPRAHRDPARLRRALPEPVALDRHADHHRLALVVRGLARLDQRDIGARDREHAIGLGARRDRAVRDAALDGRLAHAGELSGLLERDAAGRRGGLGLAHAAAIIMAQPMKSIWTIFTNANSEDKARRVANLVIERLDAVAVEVEVLDVAPYPKTNGHVVRLTVEFPSAPWADTVVTALRAAQNVGYSWEILGSIETELDAVSSKARTKGVQLITFYVQLAAPINTSAAAESSGSPKQHRAVLQAEADRLVREFDAGHLDEGQAVQRFIAFDQRLGGGAMTDDGAEIMAEMTTTMGTHQAQRATTHRGAAAGNDDDDG